MRYWEYIRVEELLALQSGSAADGSDARVRSNDETLFIVVHQIYELWFKLVLAELRSVRALLRKNPVPDQALADAVRSLARVVTIFEVATEHWRVVETLGTRDYLAFRDALVGASGFQSAQMRQIEILLGLDDERRLSSAGEHSYKDFLRGPSGGSSPALERVEAELADGPSLKHALGDWLSRTPIDGSTDEADVSRYLESFVAAHERHANALCERARGAVSSQADFAIVEERYRRGVAAAASFLRAEDVADPAERPKRRHIRAALVFIESHRELPRLSWPRELCERLLAVEQAMLVWRQRHARMVERVIGRRPGTGGSGGVDYLDATALRYRVFDELWTVRTVLLQAESVPAMSHADDYRLRVEDD
ncbi:MAG: tryptophan 2,3-dioxygenase [Polyangiaceae bacterium]|nr:tryptophan 2,3-dioxygenase [Polyangiaceae bacterium]